MGNRGLHDVWLRLWPWRTAAGVKRFMASVVVFSCVAARYPEAPFRLALFFLCFRRLQEMGWRFPLWPFQHAVEFLKRPVQFVIYPKQDPGGKPLKGTQNAHGRLSPPLTLARDRAHTAPPKPIVAQRSNGEDVVVSISWESVLGLSSQQEP